MQRHHLAEPLTTKEPRRRRRPPASGLRAREGVRGALGRVIALLGRGLGLLLGLECTGQGVVASSCAVALHFLCGGGGSVGLLLGDPLGDLVILNGNRGVMVVLPVVRSGGRHGRRARHSRAGARDGEEALRGERPARLEASAHDVAEADLT